MEKGELIKLMLEYELFEEKIFWSSDSDFFQSYLEFLYLKGEKTMKTTRETNTQIKGDSPVL